MNAIAPYPPQEAAERTTRHLRLCAELADLAMQLARAAAARTLADWAEPETPPAAAPLTQSPPEPLTQSLTEPPPQSKPAPRHPALQTAAASHKPTDPAVLFTRLAAVVRDCIALEARLAAGGTQAASTRISRADPRRAKLREAIGFVIANRPDRTGLLREATARLDEELAADPDQTIGPGHLLCAICDDLGIELDLAKLPDEYLFVDDELEDLDEDPPDPDATPPP